MVERTGRGRVVTVAMNERKRTRRRHQESGGGEGSPRGKRLDRVGESVVTGSQMVGEIEPG